MSAATSRRWSRPVIRRRDTRRTAPAAAMDRYLQANRELWDEWTRINYQSDFYKVDAFRAGPGSLRPYGPGEAGPAGGKTLPPLQSPFGPHTLPCPRPG